MSEPTTDREIIADSLGVGIGVGLYGITFGALATTGGMSVWQACALSFLAFTGASQFAFLGVVASGGAPMTGALTAVLLGIRNTFYGITLAPVLRVKGLRRLATAHIVIDESTAMSVVREDPRQGRLGFYWTGLTIFAIWNLMTLIGAVAGERIGDPRAIGLDAAVAAAFLGLLWPRLDSTPSRLLALLAAAVALGLVPFTPPGAPIIIGGIVAVLVGLRFVPTSPGGHDE
ncbi:AzlC family ABC transporter permease [Aeromicrobium choanae]|uniref:Predicted branched-chain amino acid permease (Azaleucine resistance) n=1 Tax=Aeromicrobium choanae TaxID=1736691 RepID=A0A1T4YNI9_9ACTN|nr:AzlC family ABC transporter permease [Aeromicrobium choanae]SKB03253.1 Predicted branched-chain amino acid permease (azaleucine resistance) [Aeromicrobium choanae]